MLYFLEPKHPDAESLVVGEGCTHEEKEKAVCAQRRLSAYRSLVFWTWNDIGKHRRPLPSCVYAMVRAVFCPAYVTDEEFADMDHTLFIEDPGATEH